MSESVNQIMKAALEDLAQQGNETAKFALNLASKVVVVNNEQVLRAEISRELRAANAHLAEALGHNDLKWSRATDNAIERGRTSILNALVKLG